MITKPLAVFVPWLHMHQPPIWVGEGEEGRLIGNLEKMLHGPENSEERWNAGWYARAYLNPAHYVQRLSAQGYAPRLMLDYSGVLLEELDKLSHDGTFANYHVQGEPLGNVIAQLRKMLAEYPEAVEFAGTAYSHCYFPATPERDHEAQIMEWRAVFAELFGEKALARVRGFWLPEMGMLGDGIEALRLVRLIKKCGYEWVILPASALERPADWSTVQLENQVHRLVIAAEGEGEEILCVVRDTEMGIRQQSGQNADGCIGTARQRGAALKQTNTQTPALVVPTSDGENGNVMMFEFFPNGFAPLFENQAHWPEVEFLTVSQYLDKYLPDGPTSQVRLAAGGGSWIGGHHSWKAGERRVQVLEAVEQLSRDVAQARLGASPRDEWALEQAAHALLVCETSCYVYWDSEFWTEQAYRCLGWARTLLPTP
ncbi:glycoside hydrolase [Gloeobacter violaceus]|uniref:Glr2625 protein n=1 Tax=Gloeobacter violaceus (strain ATCC 29082 / PCC 7421) TaxID=251221 RepID=Q7NHB2_GLOVI|nr:glycoside hydrolase [Gloeobacter violaceus]BAC90566.1 glr2625 [Gloeobacter violaceus PCC 7421]